VSAKLASWPWGLKWVFVAPVCVSVTVRLNSTSVSEPWKTPELAVDQVPLSTFMIGSMSGIENSERTGAVTWRKGL